MDDRDGGMYSIESPVNVDHSIQNSIPIAGFAVKAGGRRRSEDARRCHLPGDDASRILDRLTTGGVGCAICNIAPLAYVVGFQDSHVRPAGVFEEKALRRDVKAGLRRFRPRIRS